nr:hypothetical protein CTI12_AA443780 [Tanacetum cinerariifolium]
MNTQPVRDNANVFQSFNSYAKAVLGNKSVGVSGNNDASNIGEKPMGVSVSNKANEESSNEALMFISEDDCIDLDGMEHSILAKVKDISVITDINMKINRRPSDWRIKNKHEGLHDQRESCKQKQITTKHNKDRSTPPHLLY